MTISIILDQFDNTVGKSSIFTNIKFIFIIAFIWRLWVSLHLISYNHPDELYQAVEIAFYRATQQPWRIKPWEFQTGHRNVIWPFILTPIVWILLQLGIYGRWMLFSLRVFLSLINLLSLFTLYKMLGEMKIFDKQEYNKQLQTVSVWLLAIYPPFVIGSLYLNTDGISLSLFIISLYPLRKAFMNSKEVKSGTSHNSFMRIFQSNNLHSGLIVGFVLSLRPPFVVFYSIIYVQFLIKKNWKIIITTIIGSLPAGLFDWYYYGFPYISYWNFLKFNLLDQKNAYYFEVEPWYHYILGGLFYFYAPLGIFMLYLIWNNSKNFKQPQFLQYLLLGAITYFVIFQSMDYRKIRFMFPFFTIVIISIIPPLINLYNSHVNFKLRKWLKLSLIIYSLISMSIIIAYPHDSGGNLIRAQEYVQDLEQKGSISIMNTWMLSGGYLTSFPEDFDYELYFLPDLDETKIIENLQLSTYLISDYKHNRYDEIMMIANSECVNLVLLETFDDFPKYSSTPYLFDSYYYIEGNYIEVWLCNL